MAHDPTFWLIARATGLLALALVSATVIAGLVLKGRPLPMLRPAGITDVHRFLSLLGLMAVGLHGIALVLDSTVEVSLQALVVPGLVPYRPLWTGIGVAVAELMLLIHLSFRFRKKIGVKNWRRLHFVTYLMFIGAMAHGLLSGTDSGRPWALAAYTSVTATVAGLTAWRASTPRRSPPREPSRAPAPPRAAAAHGATSAQAELTRNAPPIPRNT
jgi:sulfoxide reductase heme-binding subunit YedZ